MQGCVPVVGGCTAAKFVEDDQGALRRVLQNRRCLRQFNLLASARDKNGDESNHEGRLAGEDAIASAEASEDLQLFSRCIKGMYTHLINGSQNTLHCGYKGADLGHQRAQTHEPQQRRLAAHVGPCQQEQRRV